MPKKGWGILFHLGRTKEKVKIGNFSLDIDEKNVIHYHRCLDRAENKIKERERNHET